MKRLTYGLIMSLVVIVGCSDSCLPKKRREVLTVAGVKALRVGMRVPEGLSRVAMIVEENGSYTKWRVCYGSIFLPPAAQCRFITAKRDTIVAIWSE